MKKTMQLKADFYIEYESAKYNVIMLNSGIIDIEILG